MTLSSSILLDRLTRLHPKKIDLGLDRVNLLLGRLGHPESDLPPVIHVAGTNGKGSVIAFLRAMLSAAGYRVHTYTSPHLIRFNERITLGSANNLLGRPISDSLLEQILNDCEAANHSDPITFFEITTAAAFTAFSRTPADVLLLEVGLGGQFDATNVIEKPAISVITPVSLDHQEFLGTEIRQVAREKAGILKLGVPGIIGPQTDDGRDEIERYATHSGGPLFIYGQDYRGFEERNRFIYEDDKGLIDLPLPRLAGRHQLDNAAIAIACFRKFHGENAPRAAMEQGLKSADWPARLQRLPGEKTGGTAWQENPPEIWLDGGHNPHAGYALAQAMADLEDHVHRPLYLVMGMMNNKDVEGFLSSFTTLATKVIAVPIPDQKNAMAPEDICAAAHNVGINSKQAKDVSSALIQISLAGQPPNRHDGSPRILICGSLYLAGHVLEGLSAF